MAIVEAGCVAILGVVVWALVVGGAALVGAGLLPRLLGWLGRRLRRGFGRDEAGAARLRLYLFLWLLAIAVWVTVFGLLLTPSR